MDKQNAYSVLGLRKGAVEDQVKEAYVELVKKFDPEKHTDRFMVIQEAYERLRDPAKRAREDILLFNQLPGRFLFAPEERSKDPDAQLNQQVAELEEQAGNQGDNPEAQAAFTQALMMRSFKKVTKRLWAEAIEDWQRILNVDPTHQRAKNNLLNAFGTLGYSYAEHDLHEEALELWEKALHMNPDDERLVHNLAIAAEMTGKQEVAKHYWADTLDRWQARIDADPDDVYAKRCIIEVRRHHGGQAGEGSENTPASIEEYREILKINPNDFEAQYKIATSLMEEQKWDDARQSLETLLRQYPKNIEILNLLGWAYLNSGHVEQAFMAWKRSLTFDPKNHSTREAVIKGRMSMGRIFRNKGMYTQSLVHFKALLRFTPKSAEVNMEIGQTYMLKGDKRSAAVAFRNVLILDPKSKAARQNLSDMKLRV